VEPPVDAESAANAAETTSELRLPIYDSIESEWFRRGSPSFNGAAPPAGTSWTSPADEGFRRAAQTVGSPAVGRTTNAGLPKRVPSANLVPGSIGTRPKGQQAGQAPRPATRPVRSPEEARTRLQGFQVRGREGRTDAPGEPGTNEN
jgi:hypothetical protein